MKPYLIKILCLLLPLGLIAQTEFHVFPVNDKTKKGTPSGDGSLEHPWDLQTALSQTADIVDGGDTIWLHEGIYNGRYLSTISSTKGNKTILVAPFNNEKVVLNGNVESIRTSVLEVKGQRVIFKNIEITFLGEFSRNVVDSNFQKVNGLSHMAGEDCSFINLKIHNNPGSGMGSWKGTGGSIIDGCSIFNNGYFSKVRGSGAGIYVQNNSDKRRMIMNSTIFNNYYMGIEVWSASKSAKSQYIKNITVKNNIVFNNGLPGGKPRNNIIVATNDKNGINRAEDINILENVLYHNNDFLQKTAGGDEGSLTLGHNFKAPLKNVTVKNNIIIGGNNALRLNTAESTTFQNNIVYGGYVHLNKAILDYIDTWNFNHNTYYSKKSKAFRIVNHSDLAIKEWTSKYPIDANSQWKHIKEFDLNPVLDVTRNNHNENQFRVTVFEKDGNDVTVDFSEYGIFNESTYMIKNIATGETIASGVLDASKKITFPMATFNDTSKNFGVYELLFESQKKKRDNFFKRLFKWLF